jgi:hypothetical protein
MNRLIITQTLPDVISLLPLQKGQPQYHSKQQDQQFSDGDEDYDDFDEDEDDEEKKRPTPKSKVGLHVIINR